MPQKLLKVIETFVLSHDAAQIVATKVIMIGSATARNCWSMGLTVRFYIGRGSLPQKVVVTGAMVGAAGLEPATLSLEG